MTEVEKEGDLSGRIIWCLECVFLEISECPQWCQISMALHTEEMQASGLFLTSQCTLINTYDYFTRLWMIFHVSTLMTFSDFCNTFSNF